MLMQEYEANDDLLSGQIVHTRRLPPEGFTWGSNHKLNTMEPAYFPNACIIEPSVQNAVVDEIGCFIKANSSHGKKLMFSLSRLNTVW